MKLHLTNVKAICAISITIIIILSISLQLYVDAISEQDVRDNLFRTQQQRQLDSTKLISEHIRSDLSSFLIMMDGLASSEYLQQEDFVSEKSHNLVQEKFDIFRPLINRLFILDSDDVVRMSFSQGASETFVGDDLSTRDWVKEVKKGSSAGFSSGFELQGIYMMFISYPVIDRDDGHYIGSIAISVPTIPFFSTYGNVRESGSNYLMIYDQKGTILASGASSTLIGHNFFEEYSQQFFNHNQILTNLTNQLLNGSAGYAVYDYGDGEKLTTQSLVVVNNQKLLFVQLTMPTDEVYSAISDAISILRTRMLILLAGSIAAVVVLVVLLIIWNRALEVQVKVKTTELLEAERKQRELENSVEGMRKYLDDVLKELQRKG